jgi:hypothetical protein
VIVGFQVDETEKSHPRFVVVKKDDLVLIPISTYCVGLFEHSL